MTKKLVAVSGRAGAGKDYVTDIMINHLHKFTDLRAVKIPWALRVREEIEETLGVVSPQLYNKPTTADIRALLQWWGTDFRRAQDEDYWVKQGLRHAEITTADAIFFPDTRFVNEALGVMDAGGKSVRVEAPEFRRINRIGHTPNHAFEKLADSLPVDFMIDNSKDVRPIFPGELLQWFEKDDDDDE